MMFNTTYERILMMKRNLIIFLCLMLCAVALFSACTTKPEPPMPTVEPTIAPTPESTPENTDNPDAGKAYLDGEYEVGVDIPASTYYAITDWGRDASVIIRDSSGNVLLEDKFKRGSIVVLDEGVFVEVINCLIVDISKTKNHVAEVLYGSTPDGAYIIGFHIDAGGYTLTPYEKYTDTRYVIYTDVTRQTVVDEGDITEAITIRLEDGQVIFLYNSSMAKAD